jgi:hypothetical protein
MARRLQFDAFAAGVVSHDATLLATAMKNKVET